ncbi:MAG: hypothetical protein WD894_22780 [Pirellulales bacterium]
MQVALRIILGGCLFLLVGGFTPLKAQDSATAPENVSATTAKDGDSSSANASTSADDTRWRYKQHDGHWWYWLPSNRWVVWSNGDWVDPPMHAIESDRAQGPQYQTAPQYIAPSPAARLLQPRPRSWYYTGRVYDGPYYYYDEFYEPYGGARPYPYYPEPRPYTRRPYNAGRYPYYAQPGVGVSIGGGSGVGIGIGF